MLTHHQGPLSLHLLLHFKVTLESILPFDPTQGQKPVGGMLGQELSLSSLPTKQSQPAAALPSTEARALSTFVSLDTNVRPAEGPAHNQTAPQGAIRYCPSLYSLSKTPIVYDQLSFELQTYPFESDRLLLNGFKFGFSLQYTGPRMYREARNLKSAREAPDLVE